MKSQLIGKDPDAEKDLDAGKDRRLEEKEMTEEEMVGWHHRLNGREFEQASGDSEGQGSLACYSSWGHRQSDITKRLNKNTYTYINTHTCTIYIK